MLSSVIPSYRLGTIAEVLVAIASLTAFMTPASAQEHHHTVVIPGEVEFQQGPPSLPVGAQIAVLYGNPAEEGPFALRLKFPAGYTVPPHTHPNDEIVTVISGNLGLTAGDILDQSAAPLLAAGSLVVLPSGISHFAWVEEETVLQLNSIGPLEITYLQDADDPRVK